MIEKGWRGSPCEIDFLLRLMSFDFVKGCLAVAQKHKMGLRLHRMIVSTEVLRLRCWSHEHCWGGWQKLDRREGHPGTDEYGDPVEEA
jgi:hypothetical protein